MLAIVADDSIGWVRRHVLPVRRHDQATSLPRDAGGVMDRVVAQLLAEIDGVQAGGGGAPGKPSETLAYTP